MKKLDLLTFLLEEEENLFSAETVENVAFQVEEDKASIEQASTNVL